MALPLLPAILPFIGTAFLGIGGLISSIFSIVSGIVSVAFAFFVQASLTRIVFVAFFITLTGVLYAAINAAYVEIGAAVAGFDFGSLVYSVIPTSTGACIAIAITVDVARWVYDFSLNLGESASRR